MDPIVIIIMAAPSASEMVAVVCKTTPPRITKDPPDSGQMHPVILMKMLAP